MAIVLQVREVRDAIYRAAGGPASAGEGERSTALLGDLFHQIFADLVGADAQKNFRAALDNAEPQADQWRLALVHHTYHRLVEPRLRTHQPLLHGVASQVLTFWEAVKEMCGWLSDALWQAHECGFLLAEVSPLVSAEQPLCLEVREAGWTETVRLTGSADSVWTIPATGRWCLIELKTGRTSPEADLGQACLYHWMLRESGKGDWGTLALISFEPTRRERLFSAGDLGKAQDRLKDLIGRMAGVLPDQQPPPTAHRPLPEAMPEHLKLGEQLVRTLKGYGLEVELDGPPLVGPTFLRYPIALGKRVTLNAVERLSRSVQAHLKVDAPPRVGMEGRRVVIDLQRPDRQIVSFSQIRNQLPERDPLTGCACATLGVDIAGNLRLADFTEPENAHLLVAGTTGSGKTEWLRSAVAGLLATNTPATLRLVLIDPKRNAFQRLQDSPFLYSPLVYPEDQSVARILESLADEMETRYRLMSEVGSDSLVDYIRHTGIAIPRIFCICDEFANLLLGDREERRALEQQVHRLGQKARAAGIHLILATQQPSREIIRGPLASNIPARVGLKMNSAIESRMLLGCPGAETLLGRGDLLFKCIGEPIRLQSAYLPSEEFDQVLSGTRPATE
jgi:hypothetical protein